MLPDRGDEREPDNINSPGSRDIGFEVVLSTTEILALDAAGNAKAAKLLGATGTAKRGERGFAVDITGSVSGETIYVDSISAAN